MGTRRGTSDRYPAPAAVVACRAENLPDVRFAVPGLPTGHVDRSRLTRRLDRAERPPLTLVRAPAGTGKTTLVSAWVRAGDASADTAWVTFDNGPLRAADFWSAVCAAVRRQVDLGPLRAVAAVERPGRRAATSLAAAVAARQRRLTLVLDGFEHVSECVAADLDFLIRHSGDRLRLLVLSRVEPALPLHRYRLDDTIHEVGASDLRFTDCEARRLLALAGVELSAAAAGRLNSNCGGWAAGLRFAARSLARRTDPGRAEADVSGATGEAGDYLRVEMLLPQTERSRQVLVGTCVVDILEPGLVEALAGPAAARSLAALAVSNTFVEPLPDRPGHYRMQPMFREMLLRELAESPRLRTRLHRRAARWYSGQGRIAEAVRHAGEAEAWRAAAGFVVDDLAVAQLLTSGQTSSDTGGLGNLARSLRPMPERVPGPAAAVTRAALALADGEADRCADQLALARESCGASATLRARNVLLAVDILEAVRSCFVLDPRRAQARVRVAERGLAGCAPEPLGRHPELGALMKACEGVALLRRGDLPQAHEAMQAATAGVGAVHAHGCEPMAVSCLGYLALLAALQGHLRRGRDWANKALAKADALRLPPAERPAAARVALAWVSTEQYELAEARDHVRAARRCRTLHTDPVPRLLLAIVRSRLARAQDDLRGALSALDAVAEELAATPDWLTDQLRLEQAAVRLALGDTSCAVDGLDGLARPGDLRGALLRAQAQMDQDPELSLDGRLSRLLVPAQPLQALVAGWLLEAANRLRAGEVDKARLALERSLRLAAPERLRRPLHEAPAEVTELLADELRRAGHARWLGNRTLAGAGRTPSSPHVRPDIGEQLTARELEVLGYVAELLSTQEIAATMFVSVNTVRTHVRSILRKLGVSRRNEAVRRARELGLIGSG